MSWHYTFCFKQRIIVYCVTDQNYAWLSWGTVYWCVIDPPFMKLSWTLDRIHILYFSYLHEFDCRHYCMKPSAVYCNVATIVMQCIVATAFIQSAILHLHCIRGFIVSTIYHILNIKNRQHCIIYTIGIITAISYFNRQYWTEWVLEIKRRTKQFFSHMTGNVGCTSYLQSAEMPNFKRTTMGRIWTATA